LLTEYLSAGYIDYETYLELLPAQVAVFKNSLLKQIKEGNTAQLKQAQEQILALQEQLKQATEALKMYAQRLEAQGQTVDKVNNLINQNRALSKTLMETFDAATQRANEAQRYAMENASVKRDAQTMAMMMAEDDEANMQEAQANADALSALSEKQ
jgi:paraquat-inducible protein B